MSATIEQAIPVTDKPRDATVRLWITLLFAVVAIGIAFKDGIAAMWEVWTTTEEYSHGPIIPLIATFLVWQKRYDIGALLTVSRSQRGTWGGVALLLAGVAINLMGTLAALHVLQQYALVITVTGMVWALVGWRAMRLMWAPLLLLWLMIPLPSFFMNNLSASLQLISSQFGVWFIRLAAISVFVEGNVIDLGGYKLQVAEACNGLRYLFPLLTLGFIMAYLFKVAMWKRVLLFLSSIPITIFMNSMRIGVIGVMVEFWGTSMAEGFLHDFQGWAVFMCSGATMLLEMMVLARIGNESRNWREVFGLEFPHANGRPAFGITRPSNAFTAGAVMLATVAIALMLLPTRLEAVPARESFVSFPQSLAGWEGRRAVLESIYIDTLMFDDYVLTDYSRPSGEGVNFYVAWYDSQRAGQSAHSPRSCLPGGGWKMTEFGQRNIEGVMAGDAQLRINRTVIELGQQRQLVYYWFQQRGRVITNEYMVKWYLFWDSLTRQRSDGALVRLVTPLRNGEDMAVADARLAQFARDAVPRLERHIPR
jgi:exosortase D (VPLPA-CTERM-specific)